jgi:hypothetical protein
MIIDCDNQYELVDWLCGRLDLVPSPHITAIGSYNDEGRLIGVAGYDGFTGTACDMHMAGEPGWLSKRFLHYAFYYPFIEIGCKITIAKVSSGNIKALEMDKRMGFKEICVIPDAHPEGALHVLIMRREECKWLRVQHHGQEQSQEAENA